MTSGAPAEGLEKNHDTSEEENEKGRGAPVDVREMGQSISEGRGREEQCAEGARKFGTVTRR